jgi:hypothetical protein
VNVKRAHRYSVLPCVIAEREGAIPILTLSGRMWDLMASRHAPAAGEVQASLLNVRAKLRWSRPMLAAFLGTSEVTLRR